LTAELAIAVFRQQPRTAVLLLLWLLLWLLLQLHLLLLLLC
jgi:hypothetical protein